MKLLKYNLNFYYIKVWPCAHAPPPILVFATAMATWAAKCG